MPEFIMITARSSQKTPLLYAPHLADFDLSEVDGCL